MTTIKYRVNEMFSSVQGEGVLVGVPSTFIRLQVCTVGCPWCDTKYTWAQGGELYTLEDIVKVVESFGNQHVVITGGEPTYWNLDPLLAALHELNLNTQLETSGQNALKGKIRPRWVTWSPKQNLGFEAPMAIKNIVDEVKYVIDDVIQPEDIQKGIDYMFYERRDPRIHIVLMPEGCPPETPSIHKTMQYLKGADGEIDFHNLPTRFGWRLQYTLKVR
jgi:organic radical activating enzyme